MMEPLNTYLSNSRGTHENSLHSGVKWSTSLQSRDPFVSPKMFPEPSELIRHFDVTKLCDVHMYK